MMPAPVDNLSAAPTGFSAYAELRAGSNGDPYGAPEEVLGTVNNANAGRFTWDGTDDNGGFDAENVPVSVDINLKTGADTLLLGSVPIPLTFPGPSGQTINYIEMTAGTDLNAQVAWSNVQVAFYKQGVLQETASVPGGPAVDTTTSDDPTEEQLATIQPAASDDDEAIITGSLNMVCPDFTYPNPEDMFAQVFVFPNS
jgi:hypothetical protein